MGGPGSGRRSAAKRGRPTKLTAQLAEHMVRLVQAGNYIETAAAACGVDRITVRRWIRAGARAKSGLVHDFCNAIKKAEATAHSQALLRLRTHGGKSWQADAWYLERKWPELWGRREVKGKQSETGPQTLAQMADKLNLNALTSDELKTLVELVGKAQKVAKDGKKKPQGE